MRRMSIATPYKAWEVYNSTGLAAGMYIDQWEFPLEYEDDEQFTMKDDDRIDFEYFNSCARNHGWKQGDGLLEFVGKIHGERCLSFIVDVLAPGHLRRDKNKAGTDEYHKIEWTGYRVMSTINRGNGNTVWHLQLFAKNPNSGTRVYSGPFAPNVQEEEDLLRVRHRW